MCVCVCQAKNVYCVGVLFIGDDDDIDDVNS